MALSKFHKTTLSLMLVATPLIWFMFTEDGKQRVDTLVLWLAGGDPISINFQALKPSYDMATWRTVYSDVDWRCQAQATDWGTDTCIAEISSYDGIPARYVTVFFNQSQVSGLKLAYRDQYHRQMGFDLQQQLGHASEDQGVLKWQSPYGVVLLKKELTNNPEDAVLLWIPTQTQP